MILLALPDVRPPLLFDTVLWLAGHQFVDDTGDLELGHLLRNANVRTLLGVRACRHASAPTSSKSVSMSVSNITFTGAAKPERTRAQAEPSAAILLMPLFFMARIIP